MIKQIIKYLTSPKTLLAFIIAWMITNGWAYVLLGLGLFLGNGVMITIGGGYLAFLWLPFTPEKILTLLLTGIIAKRLFQYHK